MSKAKDMEYVNMKCSGCGTPIQIRYGTYRKSKTGIHFCRKCRGIAEKNRIASLSDNDRNQYLSKKNQSISNGWKNQSDEKKASISKKRKESWTDERKANHSEMLKNRWNQMDDTEKNYIIIQLSNGRDDYWKDLDNWLMQSNRAREQWYNQSEEDQKRILQSLENGRKEYYENLSDEELLLLRQKQQEGIQRYWDTLPEDKYNERIQKFRESLKDHFDSLDLFPNRNELQFIHFLDEYELPYEYTWINQTKPDEFDSLFPNNPYRPSMNVYPYHSWDFRIPTKHGDILVDVDGSIHDPNSTNNMVTDYSGNQFKLSDYIQFKDSQRPYQTDGLDAYIVQCYADEITYGTPVKNIQTGETMSLDAFIGILLWLDLTDEEQQAIARII